MKRKLCTRINPFVSLSIEILIDAIRNLISSGTFNRAVIVARTNSPPTPMEFSNSSSRGCRVIVSRNRFLPSFVSPFSTYNTRRERRKFRVVDVRRRVPLLFEKIIHDRFGVSVICNAIREVERMKFSSEVSS